jgi:TPR repeat protein
VGGAARKQIGKHTSRSATKKSQKGGPDHAEGAGVGKGQKAGDRGEVDGGRENPVHAFIKSMYKTMDKTFTDRGVKQHGSKVIAEFQQAVIKGIQIVTLGREAYDISKVSMDKSEWKCSFCMKQTANLRHCSGCKARSFCSDDCAYLGWHGVGDATWHKVECMSQRLYRKLYSADEVYTSADSAVIDKVMKEVYRKIEGELEDRFKEETLRKAIHKKFYSTEPLTEKQLATQNMRKSRIWEKAFHLWKPLGNMNTHNDDLNHYTKDGQKNALLVMGKDNKKHCKHLFQDRGIDNPLFYAVNRVNAAALTMFIEAGEDVNEVSSNKEGHTVVLFSKEIKLHSGNTPLFAATCNAKFDSYIGSMQCLIQAGALVDLCQSPGGCQPIWQAVFNAPPSAVAVLLEANSDPNCRMPNENRTLLQDVMTRWDRKHEFMTSADGCQDIPRIVKLLLEYGADVSINAVDSHTSFHGTALHLAVCKTAESMTPDTQAVYLNTVRQLIAAGADLGQSTKVNYGCTPTMMALMVQSRREELLVLLRNMYDSVITRFQNQINRGATSEKILKQGDYVKIVGLDITGPNAFLNGQPGWVVSLNVAGRHEVRCGDGKVIFLRAECCDAHAWTMNDISPQEALWLNLPFEKTDPLTFAHSIAAPELQRFMNADAAQAQAQYESGRTELCPVCMGDLMDPVVLSCTHQLCRSCVQNLKTLTDAKGAICPMCRAPLTEARKHVPEVGRLYDAAVSNIKYMHSSCKEETEEHRRQFQQSIQHLKRVIEIEPQHVKGLQMLGMIYKGGPGAGSYQVAPDFPQASLYFRTAAELGDAEAQHELALLLCASSGPMYTRHGKSSVNVDGGNAEAAKWAKTSAEQGYTLAQVTWGAMLMNGDNGAPVDKKAAMELFRISAAAGNAEAKRNMGKIYLDGDGVKKDPRKAVEWLTEGAADGDADCQVELMRLHTMGELQNHAVAAKWGAKAAAQGNCRAQCMMGIFYKAGWGVKPNQMMAAALFKKSADQNHPEALLWRGRACADGNGTTKNMPEALACFRKALHQTEDLDAASQAKLLLKTYA